MPKAYKLTGKIKLDLTKPILLSLDAFGTIYHPKQTIVKTYIKYAKKYGLRNLDQKVVSEKFTEGDLSRLASVNSRLLTQVMATSSFRDSTPRVSPLWG